MSAAARLKAALSARRTFLRTVLVRAQSEKVLGKQRNIIYYTEIVIIHHRVGNQGNPGRVPQRGPG